LRKYSSPWTLLLSRIAGMSAAHGMSFS